MDGGSGDGYFFSSPGVENSIYKIGPLIFSNPHNTCFVLYRFGSINIAYFCIGTIKNDLLKAFDLM